MTSAIASRSSPLAASISIPARVTRRAKRSGRIEDSERPLERAVRRARRRRASPADRAVSKSPSWRSRSSSSRSRDLVGELGRLEHGGVLPPVQHPGDQLAAGGVVGLEDRALAGRAVGGLRRGGSRRSAPKSRSTSQAIRSRRKIFAVPLDLAELPLGAARVVAAVEVLGAAEVVLGLGGVGDLALDPREPEDPDRLALVGVADQIELPAAVDQVVRVNLALLGRVALDRVVGELDRLAAARSRSRSSTGAG